MVNKLWYKEGDEYAIFARNYLQKLINLYCFDSELYKEPEDITLDNLQQFIEIILKHFQYYHLFASHLFYLGDAFDTYIRWAFIDLFPDAYPKYPKLDRRELTLFVCDGCTQSSGWNIFPEDVPFILKCLNAPDNQIIHMYDKIDKYFEQFDNAKRYIEEGLRWQILKKQRLEAIQHNHPLPIRPMDLELDMCYKNASNPRRGKLWEYIYSNYSPMLSEKAPDTYEKFLFGKEEDAEAIVKEYDEILINRCRECESIKYTPGSTNCSSCGASSEPLLGRK
jgi:hypothetical protein